MSKESIANDSSAGQWLAQQFLYAIKTGQNSDDFLIQLTNANAGQLSIELNSDAKKKAFWLNVYNGYVQMLLKKDPEKYKSRNAFFTSNQITIAGQQISLDFIEHGILRRSKSKWSMGYFNKIFPSALEKLWRVDTLDYRIHFALNCGAGSCPPIAFYDAEKINRQLDMATKSYLVTDVTFDSTSKVVNVPRLMSWFKADFGGNKGIISILKELQIIPAGINPKIRFKKYDWTLMLEQYKDL